MLQCLKTLIHPDAAKLVWRFNRWHHYADYSSFKKNLLIKKQGIEIPKQINEYGMKLIEIERMAND